MEILKYVTGYSVCTQWVSITLLHSETCFTFLRRNGLFESRQLHSISRHFTQRFRPVSKGNLKRPSALEKITKDNVEIEQKRWRNRAIFHLTPVLSY